MASFAHKSFSRPEEQFLPLYADDETTLSAKASIIITHIIRGALSVLFLASIVFFSFPRLIFTIAHPLLPTVQLKGLSVSSLNNTWEANITAKNPDMNYNMVLEVAKIGLYYKGSNSNEVLVGGFWKKNVELGRNKDGNIMGGGGIGKGILGNDGEESGKTRFEVEVKMVAILMPFSMWDERVGLRFLCGGVRADFVGEDGRGLLSRGGMKCRLITKQ